MLNFFQKRQKVNDGQNHLLFALEPKSGEVKAYFRKSVLSLPFSRWYVAINAYGESYKRGFYRYSSAIQHFENLVKKYDLEISEKMNPSESRTRIIKNIITTALTQHNQ